MISMRWTNKKYIHSVLANKVPSYGTTNERSESMRKTWRSNHSRRFRISLNTGRSCTTTRSIAFTPSCTNRHVTTTTMTMTVPYAYWHITVTLVTIAVLDTIIKLPIAILSTFWSITVSSFVIFTAIAV